MNRKEEQWRNEGAAYALRIAKEKGVEGLEADLRCRGICGISVVVPEAHLKNMYLVLLHRLSDTIRTLALWTLYEDYGWRGKRLKQYIERMLKHTMICDSWDNYANRYVKVSDMMKELEEKCGVETAWQEMENNLREADSKNRYISVDLAVKTLLDAGYEEPAALVMKKWQDNREE